MTNFEDISLYSCTQYDFMKTADELLSSATFADCTIDQNRVVLHEIILEGIFLKNLVLLSRGGKADPGGSHRTSGSAFSPVVVIIIFLIQ
jgi:hypothetical protein